MFLDEYFSAGTLYPEFQCVPHGRDQHGQDLEKSQKFETLLAMKSNVIYIGIQFRK